MAQRKPKAQPTGILDVVRDIVSPWLGAPAGQSRSVTQAQGLARSAAETLDQTFAGGMIKAGVQGNKALAKQAAVNVAALGTGYVAGKAMQTAVPAVINKVNPFYNVIKNAGSSTKYGEATAEQLMKLRSIDRYRVETNFKTPPKMINDTKHLANIRAQNTSTYTYDTERLYNDDEYLQKYKNLFEDIKDRGIQQPVNVGKVNGKTTLMEGNHRVIAQFDINPKTKVPFAYNKLNDIKSIKKR